MRRPDTAAKFELLSNPGSEEGQSACQKKYLKKPKLFCKNANDHLVDRQKCQSGVYFLISAGRYPDVLEIANSESNYVALQKHQTGSVDGLAPSGVSELP